VYLDPIVIARALLGGLIFGLVLGGTPLIPRRQEWRTCWVLIVASLVFGALISGFAPAVVARRTAFDSFALAIAFGSLIRRRVSVRIARGRRAQAFIRRP
jgi:hypothetical protein